MANIGFENRLLKLVSENVILYDPTHADYFKRKARLKAWAAIAKELGVDVKFCKDKWMSLRNAYRKVLRKINQRGGVDNYHRKWRYFDAISFINKFECIGSLATNLKPSPGVTQEPSLNSPTVLFRMIELLKSHKVLYDPCAPGYVDADERNYAWHSIGKELNIDKNKVRMKWHSMRSAFGKVLRNILDSGGIAKYKRKWMYFDEMTFLCPFLPNLPEDFIDSVILHQEIQADKAESSNNDYSNSAESFSNFTDDEEDDDKELCDDDSEKADKVDKLISSTVGDIEELSDYNEEHDDEEEEEEQEEEEQEQEEEGEEESAECNEERDIFSDDYMPPSKKRRKVITKQMKIESVDRIRDLDDKGPCKAYFSLLGSKIDELPVPVKVRFKLEKQVTDLVYDILDKYSLETVKV